MNTFINFFRLCIKLLRNINFTSLFVETNFKVFFNLLQLFLLTNLMYITLNIKTIYESFFFLHQTFVQFKYFEFNYLIQLGSDNFGILIIFKNDDFLLSICCFQNEIIFASMVNIFNTDNACAWCFFTIFIKAYI